jgi:DNA uptake protein ComE-like DNA-binding protein
MKPFIRTLSARTLFGAGSLGAALILSACGGGSDSAAPVGDSEATASESPGTVGTLAAGEKLSANTATEEELKAIPGVGDEIAHEITKYRPYDAATGEAKFREELAKYIDDAEIGRIMGYLDFSE